MKHQKSIALLLLIPGVLIFPVMSYWMLSGLYGSDPGHFYLMGAGYIIYLLGAFVGIWRKNFLYACLFGVFLFLLGSFLSNQFWKEHNESICRAARSDPHCVESEYGLDCSEASQLGNVALLNCEKPQ